ncbi:putative ATP-dependent RNA helicase TDRD12 isoform X2 [Sceloporus undulatus]|uniref:putative ATP-dependent RNA helicase TDRD12 isoform X2 n=1 Tax=Sceloporus undulatus TaxID=8520 RepID=UPI001C4C7FDE|nr:putative ATP-dependent RNA helicase TDRD12 isoform X2 [Sceloporus undulatus]
MIEVFIMKIENPGCFWVGIKGGGNFVENEMEYKKLQSYMNQFYNKYYRCMDEIKPSVLEEGQVCAVYYQEQKSWCRAIVKSIISCTDYYLAECFLVDYAKSIPVKKEKICVALESFMKLPYRAKKFRLYCTKPVTLCFNYYNDNAETVPAAKWDIAAIQYFQNLFNETTQVEAKLCSVEDDTFDVYLYVTVNGEKVCVNDDLIAKNFACYGTNERTFRIINDQTPKMLNHKSLSATENISPASILWPKLLNVEESKALEVSHPAEKATSNILPETASYSKGAVMAIPPFKQGITVSVTDLPTDSTTCEKTTCIKERKENLHEENITMKLLQFLNPEPLKSKNRQDEEEEHQLNINTHIPVVLSNKIEPCSSLENAPLFPALKKDLLRNHFVGPSHVQSYSWPAIARGCDSVVICPENDPLIYLLPIITFLQSKGCYLSLPARNGPIALIICPGQRKAELVFELLQKYSHCSRPLHPILLLLGMNKEEIKSMKIPRVCEVIVTTPHSLLRLLEYDSLLFLRLCHLVFDEADVLFSEASHQVFNILEYYKTNLNVEGKEFVPQQIVAVGSRWIKDIEYLIKEFMNDPYIVITSLEEAAIYGKLQQVVLVCLECNRISTLLQTMDFTPTNAQKTLIFTSSVKEIDAVYKAVESTSVFCLKIHPETGFHVTHVVEQWNKRFSSGTHIVLVLTDECLPALGITDATCVIHFSFPASPRIFGARLYSMSDHFQNSIEKVSPLVKEQSKAKSILLLTENNSCHAVGILHYLKRTAADIPPELSDFTSGVLETREDSKTGKPLCHCLKLYGFCKIQVLEVLSQEEKNMFYRVHIKYIDEGRTGQVQRYKLLYLPEQFQSLPPQAVEFIVCRVKPIDNEVDWNPKVTRYINYKISGKPHEAKIVLALNNTIWVDPVVRVTRLPDLKTSINEYSIRSEILATGLGVDNPEHIHELQRLFRDAETACEKKDSPALNQSLKCETSEQATSSPSILDQATHSSETTEEQVVSNVQEGDAIIDSCSQVTLQNHSNGMVQSEKECESLQPPNECFHPAIQWFEKQDFVILKIKVQNITSHSCKFFTQRIIFSGSAEGKFYWADMELKENIIEEKSSCVLKSNEAVITLAKEKEGSWCHLLKQKNPHVSFDFDHLEDSEERSTFPSGTATKRRHKTGNVVCEKEHESFQHSDTDSDSSTD